MRVRQCRLRMRAAVFSAALCGVVASGCGKKEAVAPAATPTPPPAQVQQQMNAVQNSSLPDQAKAMEMNRINRQSPR